MYRKCEIRMWINHKFQNTIFKQLPFLIYENTKDLIHKPIIEIVNEYVDNYV